MRYRVIIKAPEVCFRKPYRRYWATYEQAPPSTVQGMLERLFGQPVRLIRVLETKYEGRGIQLRKLHQWNNPKQSIGMGSNAYVDKVEVLTDVTVEAEVETEPIHELRAVTLAGWWVEALEVHEIAKENGHDDKERSVMDLTKNRARKRGSRNGARNHSDINRLERRL